MIQTTQIWELSLEAICSTLRRTLSKKYGSKRSGTIYLVADGVGEATGIAKEFFEENGIVLPDSKIKVYQTHLVKQALKKIY